MLQQQHIRCPGNMHARRRAPRLACHPTLQHTSRLTSPQDPANYQWMYCNLVMEASHLFLPLAEPQQDPSAAPPGLFLEWHQFRAGYFFGGDGTYITRLNAFELCAWAARPDGTSNVGP